MTARALNLLRHPGSPALQTSASARSRRLALLALLGGLLAGGVWAGWQYLRQHQLQQQQVRLQAQLQARALQSAPQALPQPELMQTWEQRAQVWQVRRRQLSQLHDALNVQARQSDLRLQRWQGDARQLVLHAVLRSPDDLPALMAALKTAWPADWALDKLAVREPADSAQAVDVVLQAKGWEPTVASPALRP